MANLDTLKSWELGTATVKEILADWWGVKESALMDSICEDGNIVSFWADNCNMLIADLIDWIDASLDNHAKFKIVGNNATDGSSPVCELDLGAGIVLALDYDLDI